MNQNKYCITALSGALAVSLLLSTAAYAAQTDDDDYGPMPEGVTSFTIDGPISHFVVENKGTGGSKGHVDTKEDPDRESGRTEIQDEPVVVPETDADIPSWISGYIQDPSGFSYPEIDVDAYADEIFRLANEERVKAGFSEVERREDVDPVASIRARELSEQFSHTRPNGEGYMSLMDEYGIDYDWAGENAAMVAATASPATMMNVWMNSEGHKKNILNPKHTGLGIGIYQVGQQVYCSQMFVY